MERIFSDLEGLRIAIEMEERGVEMYRHAAKISASPEAVKLLNRLEKDEREHRDEFAARYAYCMQNGAQNARYDAETVAYLSAVAADVVFPGGLTDMVRGAGLNDPAAILRNAIAAEKDSILFYEEMAARASGERERAVFAAITQQERGHLLELMQMLTEGTP